MEKKLKNILVPVDFQKPSEQALRYAVNMGRQFNLEITILHVIETPGILSEFFGKSNTEELVKLTNQIKDKLQKMIDELKAETSEIKISSRVERGKLHQKILSVAEDINARMIILGENHQGEDASKDLGSTVYHVTLKSPVPVLTLKGNIEKMNDKIIVPLDLTKEMRRKLFSAIVHGLNYGAEIHLVSALIGGIKMRESRIYKKLKQAKKTITENGLQCTTKLFPKDDEPPFRKILQYAKDVDGGLILVMTHKEGYTYDNYIGAFAHHIINESTVPVLSLTSAATNLNFSKYLQGFVDPAGILDKKKIR
ncbi:universal stress protein [Salinivirga cyanobacteriivorans]